MALSDATTRLGLIGIPRARWGSFAGKASAVSAICAAGTLSLTASARGLGTLAEVGGAHKAIGTLSEVSTGKTVGTLTKVCEE